MQYIDYDLEIEKAIDKIKKTQAKSVLIQLPDGLKPKGKEIVDALEKETEAKITIFLGACYGACDFPVDMKSMNFDLMIAWGHSKWRY